MAYNKMKGVLKESVKAQDLRETRFDRGGLQGADVPKDMGA